MSQARRRIFLAITLLVPALVLGAAELALRIAGVGALEPLFVPVPADTRYLQPNPAVIQRFFPDPRDAPDVSIDTTWFLRDKPRGLVRVFVLGESTAAGFPYGRWASPAALLQQRLARAYPGRDFEVISTAMAAVTSYVLLDFADEIVAQHPDAVVIYTGHNEYLGIGGVGSSLVSAKSPATTRAVARLRRLHLYRALEALVARVGPATPKLSDRGGTLMSRVAAERSIPLGSALYDRGLEQFRGNLDRLLGRLTTCRRARVHRHAGVQRARSAAVREPGRRPGSDGERRPGVRACPVARGVRPLRRSATTRTCPRRISMHCVSGHRNRSTA